MITSSLARSFGQIGVLTAASRVLGLLRDIVFAAFLGAGPQLTISGGAETAEHVPPVKR